MDGSPLETAAKYIGVWHKYVIQKGLSWPDSKYTHLPSRTKDILLDMGAALGVDLSSCRTKKDVLDKLLGVM